MKITHDLETGILPHGITDHHWSIGEQASKHLKLLPDIVYSSFVNSETETWEVRTLWFGHISSTTLFVTSLQESKRKNPCELKTHPPEMRKGIALSKKSKSPPFRKKNKREPVLEGVSTLHKGCFCWAIHISTRFQSWPHAPPSCGRFELRAGRTW